MKKAPVFFGPMLVCCCFNIHLALAGQQESSKGPNKPSSAKPIQLDELKEDLDFLFKTIEEER